MDKGKVKRYARIYAILALLFVLLIVFNHKLHLLALNVSSFSDSDIKVLSMNIHGTGEDFEEREKRILSMIEDEQPSFVYLTEYQDSCSQVLDSLLQKIYPSHQRGLNGAYRTECIYSNWSIDSLSDVRLDNENEKVRKYVQESSFVRNHYSSPTILRCQISKGEKMMVIYLCHLESNNYLNEVEDSTIIYHHSLRHYETLLRAYQNGSMVRELEADALHEAIEKEKLPVIVIGDFNDFYPSYAINRLVEGDSGLLKCAWWEGGIGLGNTFGGNIFGLRIDHMLYGKGVKLSNIKLSDFGMSDHRALIGDFCLSHESD